MKKKLSVTISNDIKSERDLFQIFYELLQFPEWFGFNWSALWDSLNDFQWSEDIESVSIYIESWPSIPDYDLEIFKSLMHDLDYPMVTVHFPDLT